MTDLEEFTAACFEALDFTDRGPDSEIPKDAELSEETRLDLEADCRSFWRRYGCYVNAAECNRHGNDYSKAAQAGHDFWLTRNGYGAGFWDGDWPEPYADRLDKGAKCYGEFQTYLGDDGLIYA